MPETDATNPFSVIDLVLIVPAFATILLFTPLLLLLGWIIYRERAMSQRKQPPLRDSEKQELGRIEQELAACRKRLIEIEQEGADLKRNIDGSYHRGSNRGQSLNKEIGDLTPREERLSQKYNYLIWKPTAFIRKLIHLRSMSFSFGITLPLYVISICTLSVTKPKFIMDSQTGKHDALTGVMAVCGLLSPLAFEMIYCLRSLRWNKQLSVQLDKFRKFAHAHEAHLASLSRGALNQADYKSEHSERDNAQPSQSSNASHVDNFDEPWYSVLGVPKNASRDEINAAWREKMKRNHPDRVADLDAEFQVFAERRMQRLNEARREGLRTSQ